MSAMKLWMTDEEICRHYRLAADKREAVAILADLNLAKQDEIREVLRRCGVTGVPAVRKWTLLKPEKEARVRSLLKDGMSEDEVAKALKLAKKTVEQVAERMRKDEERRKKQEYYAANREKILQRQKRYNRENKAAIKTKQREYYQKNREKLKDRGNAYYREHRDEINAACRELRRQKAQKGG